MTSVPAGGLGPPPTIGRPRSRFGGLRAVFERDFLVFTSRPRFLALRTVTVALASCIFVAALISLDGRSRYMGTSSIGSGVFITAVMALPALAMLLAPALAASSICSERSMQTLQIVLAAPVSPFAFVLAKLLSRLSVVVVLELATLPLAGLCFIYGGVSAGLFVEFTAFLFGVSLFATAIGVAASAFARSVAAAVRVAYFVAILFPIGHGVIAASISAFLDEEVGLGLSLNPLYVWSDVIGHATRGSRAGADAPIWEFLACSILVAGAALALSAWRLGRESAVEAASSGPGRPVTALKHANPVLDRALRGSLLHRPRFKSWLGLALVLVLDTVVLTMAGLGNVLDDAFPHIIFLCMIAVIASVCVMSSAGHAIAAERETGALDMLLATRLSAREVVFGKLIANLLAVSPLLAFTLVHGIVSAAVTKLEFMTVVTWSFGAFAVVFFCAALGTWCSATASTAGRGVLRTYAYMIGGAVVHGVLFAIVMLVARGDMRGVVWYIAGASPAYVLIAGPTVVMETSLGGSEMNVFAAWVLWTAVYIVAAFLLVERATARIEKQNEAR